MDFNVSKYTYKFISFPKKEINGDDVKLKIENDEKFKSIRSRIDKDNIIREIFDLTNQINFNSEMLKKYLSCISCGESLSQHSVQSLDYLICQHCHSLLDSSTIEAFASKNYKGGQVGFENNCETVQWLTLESEDEKTALEIADKVVKRIWGCIANR